MAMLLGPAERPATIYQRFVHLHVKKNLASAEKIAARLFPCLSGYAKSIACYRRDDERRRVARHSGQDSSPFEDISHETVDSHHGVHGPDGRRSSAHGPARAGREQAAAATQHPSED